MKRQIPVEAWTSFNGYENNRRTYMYLYITDKRRWTRSLFNCICVSTRNSSHVYDDFWGYCYCNMSNKKSLIQSIKSAKG